MKIFDNLRAWFYDCAISSLVIISLRRETLLLYLFLLLYMCVLVSRPLSAMAWSEICDCSFFLSYSIVLFFVAVK